MGRKRLPVFAHKPGFFEQSGRLGQFAELWTLALSDYEAHLGPVDWRRVRNGQAHVRIDVVQVHGPSQEDRETAVVHVDNYYAGHVSPYTSNSMGNSIGTD